MWRVAILGAFLCIPSFAAAQLITEVMYDLSEGSDSGREWIEVYNDTAAAITLTDLRLVESGKNHKISAVQGGASLAPLSYAVIADNAEKFKTDHPAFTGQLFDSAFSLNNTGENLALTDAKGVELDSMIYTDALGGNGTGDSLQKVSSTKDASFSAGVPSPAEAIPAGRLVQTPPKAKKTTAKTKKAAQPPVAPVPVVQGERILTDTPVGTEQLAAVSASTGTSFLWLLGVLAIAGFGGGGVFLARRAKATEWDIIEET